MKIKHRKIKITGIYPIAEETVHIDIYMHTLQSLESYKCSTFTV